MSSGSNPRRPAISSLDGRVPSKKRARSRSPVSAFRHQSSPTSRARYAKLNHELSRIEGGAQDPARAAQRAADGRARRLHERRQVVADARADQHRRLHRRQAVRDARHDGAPARAADRSADPRHRHRRLHQEAAARSRRVVPLDARRGRRRRSAAPRRRRQPIRRIADQLAVTREVLAEIGADERRRRGCCSTRSIASTSATRERARRSLSERDPAVGEAPRRRRARCAIS